MARSDLRYRIPYYYPFNQILLAFGFGRAATAGDEVHYVLHDPVLGPLRAVLGSHGVTLKFDGDEKKFRRPSELQKFLAKLERERFRRLLSPP